MRDQTKGDARTAVVGRTVVDLSPETVCDGLRRQLLAECDAMFRYAFASGVKLPPVVLDGLSLLETPEAGAASGGRITEVAALHGYLAELVAPAKPQTLYFIQNDPARDSWLAVLGPLPNIRRLMLGAVFFVLMFLGTSLSAHVNTETIVSSVYELDGLPLLVVLLYIMSAAGLGSCFNVLFTAQQYVREGTYDPKFESTYWMRITVGVMSGLMLAELVGPDVSSDTQNFGKPVLALVGGFSATLLHQILNRMVESVGSLFKGNGSDAIAAKEWALRSQSNQEITQTRMDMASQLYKVRDAIASGAPAEQLTGTLSTILDGLVPSRPSQRGRRDGNGSAGTPVAASGNIGEAAVAGPADPDPAPPAGPDPSDPSAPSGPSGSAPDPSGPADSPADSPAALLARAVTSFGPVLGDGVAPLALATAVVGVGGRLGDDPYRRWVHRALEAPFTPQLLESAALDDTDALAALRRCEVFGSAFAPEIDGGDLAFLGGLARDAAAGGPGDDLWNRFGSRFPSRVAFDGGLNAFRNVLLENGVLKSLADVPEAAAIGGPRTLIEALNRINADPPARTDLADIVRCVDGMRKAGTDPLAAFAEAQSGLVEGRP